VRPRRLRLVGVAVMVASVVALVPATADAGTMFVHSARGGVFAGGRLTLHEIRRNVTWYTATGHKRVASISVANKRLFAHASTATGSLNLGNRRRGQAFALRLSKPLYSAARRTVSYQAKVIGRAKSATTRVPRSFGAADLSVISERSPSLRDNGGNDCGYQVWNPSPGNDLDQVSASKWDTDDWAPPPPSKIALNTEPLIESEGGLWRGCHNETAWRAGTWTGAPIITIDVTWPWTQLPTTTCTVSRPDLYACYRADQPGRIVWVVNAK
jgi:hypothetical protein